jgi:hypothetical protein
MSGTHCTGSLCSFNLSETEHGGHERVVIVREPHYAIRYLALKFARHFVLAAELIINSKRGGELVGALLLAKPDLVAHHERAPAASFLVLHTEPANVVVAVGV